MTFSALPSTDSLKKAAFQRTLVILLMLAFVHGLLYMAVIPPWQVPDEPFHFLSVQLVGLPFAADAETQLATLTAETRQSTVDFHLWNPAVRDNPPRGFDFAPTSRPRSFVYYLLYLGLLPVSGQELLVQLYWLRLMSVLMNVAVVALAYFAGRLLFERDSFGVWLLPAAITFLPPHTALMAGVNDGNLAELMACLAIVFWLSGIIRGWTWTKIAGLIVLSGLAVAAKSTGAFLLAAIPLWAVIRYRRHLFQNLRWLYALIALGVLSAAVLLSGMLRSHLMSTWLSIQSVMAGKPLPGSDVLSLSGLFDTFRTFWMVLGWNSLVISNWWAIVWLMLILVALAGLVLTLIKPGAEALKAEAVYVLIACTFFSILSAPVYILITGYFRSQGRYLYPAIIPIMAVLVIGWRRWIPSGWRLEGLAAFTGFLFLFDAVVLLDYALPVFYHFWQ